MPTNTRSVLYNALKERGWQPEKGFVGYTNTELEVLLQEQGVDVAELLASHVVEEPPQGPPTPGVMGPPAHREHQTYREPEAAHTQPPVRPQDPDEMPGQRLNEGREGPLRIDDEGREWYQEEVRKPAYPKPRGRRVLKYLDTGVRTETVKNGEYVESFEVAGEAQARPAEVKITLPSYQVGVYRDPRFPFKIHCYDGREGFDLFEVQEYYGGAQLVPATVKRVYIENELCYDIRSVVQTIQAEYRQLVLQKGTA